MNKMRITKRIAAFLLSFAMIVPANNIAAAKPEKILETDVAEASDKCTMLGVYGSYFSQAQEALDRINEIRKEACEQGDVQDPRNPGRYLQPSDYVPLKWSSDLENIARIRAAEAGIGYSFMNSGHDRLNQRGTYSISSNGITSWAEDLAYYWKKDMVQGIQLWYEEKQDWLNQDASKVTGHYTSMIDPSYTYVGFGGFYSEAARYPSTMSAEFSYMDNLDETMQDAPENVMQKIEVSKEFIKETYLEGDDKIVTGGTTTVEPRVMIQRGNAVRTLWTIAEDITYTSSNPDVATVTEDGVVNGKAMGTTTITARSGDSILAQKEIIVECDHEYEFSKIDSGRKCSGVCTICGDEIQFTPPAQIRIYWNNSRNNSSSGDYMYSSFIPSNNVIGSKLYCWIQVAGGDEDYQTVIMESSNENVAVPCSREATNSADDYFDILGAGVTTLTIYPKYNPALKRTFTLRVEGDEEASPTPDQSATPTPTQSAAPTPDQSEAPTPDQSAVPTPTQSAAPTPDQSAAPIPDQSAAPTPDQSEAPMPTPAQSAVPTPTPIQSVAPTVKPSAKPTAKPGSTIAPTQKPTAGSNTGNASGKQSLENQQKEEDTGTDTTLTQYVPKGTSIKVKGLYYKVNKVNVSKGIYEVICTGSKNKKIKKVTIPNTVTYKGVSYRVTGIGKKAFYKYRKLKKIKIQSLYLKKGKIGKNAFRGISKQVSVYVPTEKMQTYLKWLKKAGLKFY